CNFSIMNGQLHDKSYREGSSKGGSKSGNLILISINPLYKNSVQNNMYGSCLLDLQMIFNCTFAEISHAYTVFGITYTIGSLSNQHHKIIYTLDNDMADNGSNDTKMKSEKTTDLFPERNFFMNESKSDVVFITDGQRVPALRYVLMVGSVYFEAMFSGSFAETDKKEIEIKDTTYEAFKAIVWYLYSRKLSFNDKEDMDCDLVYDVSKLADAYDMDYLTQLINTTDGHLLAKLVAKERKPVYYHCAGCSPDYE
ncbi:unnamed protein product, partial [Medioppia subpectinata]